MNNQHQGLGAERLRRQGGSPAVPVQFTPLQGLVSVARTLAARMGLQEMWPGSDGLESVVREKLTQVGVPESVSLKLTPRSLAEQAGLIKKNRPRRRLRK